MLHYVTICVTDLARAGVFYDSVLNPLGWRRQSEDATAISWGLVKPVFYVVLAGSGTPGMGAVSFAAKSIPAVKAAWQAGLEHGGENDAKPGSAALQGNINYVARLLDPDGHTIEIAVAP